MQDAIVHQSVAKYCPEIKACGTVMGKGDKPNVVRNACFTVRRHNKTNQEKKNKRNNEKIFDEVSKCGNSKITTPFHV